MQRTRNEKEFVSLRVVAVAMHQISRDGKVCNSRGTCPESSGQNCQLKLGHSGPAGETAVFSVDQFCDMILGVTSDYLPQNMAFVLPREHLSTLLHRFVLFSFCCFQLRVVISVLDKSLYLFVNWFPSL